MTDPTHRPAPDAPRLPPPGWLPDPSHTEHERYWDGSLWTAQVRDRITRVPVEQRPSSIYSSSRDVTRPLLVTLVVLLVVVGLGWLGVLPSWVPGSDSIAREAPSGPSVDYPVYGSDELVRYLARSMIAQEDAIDVSYWVHSQGASTEDVWDAQYEASTQNPYVFSSEWSQSASVIATTVRPTYYYDKAEADRRRAATKSAVQVAIIQTGAGASQDDSEKAARIHDYVTAQATYDQAAFEAIETMAAGDVTPQIAQSQQAYAILVEGTAVCTGYAQAFQLLADAAELESVIVTGDARGGVYTGSHAWNRVQIDGVWKTVDATWDDHDGGPAGREYFLLDDGDPMLATRTVGESWVVDAQIGNYFN